MTEIETEQTEPKPKPAARTWRPLNARQRRVVGVLVEKAKTTPDGYPMTLKALTTGCNQKSNRSPQMELTTAQVDDTLEELREMGAVAEVQGDGRVPKYRHYMYDWLGVDKQEIAVVTELLLRGEQTLGELRGRASRMESITGLSELKPLLQSLQEKGLLLELTPAGRGQIVTHGLYPERERQALFDLIQRRQAADQLSDRSPATSQTIAATGATAAFSEFAELQNEVSQLRAEVAELREALRKIQE